MPDIAEWIAGWQRDGLIDAETAVRLRASIETDAAESATPEIAAGAADAQDQAGTDEADAARPTPLAAPPASAATGYFGPVVQVAEVFAYLGVGFLASAWTAYIASSSIGSSDPRIAVAFGSAISAFVFALGFFVLKRGDARRQRAAGVCAVVATGYVAASAWAISSMVTTDDATLSLCLSALVALVIAVVFRLAHPSLLTQYAILVAGTALAAGVLDLMGEAIFGPPSYDEPVTAPNGVLKVVLEGLWWVAIAIAFGVLGLREADAVEDPAAQRRAGLTRLWAGLVIVIGVASAVTRSGPLRGAEYDFGRILEPWIADTILVVIAAGLVGRAFRRHSTAFLFTGALALLIALTDFNASYLSDSIQIGLMVEGIILLGVGFAAHQLRGLLDRGGEATPAAA